MFKINDKVKTKSGREGVITDIEKKYSHPYFVYFENGTFEVCRAEEIEHV